MKPLFVLFSILSLSLSAENRIFNGSFELGMEGFVLERILRPDTNPALTFTDPVPEQCSDGTVLRIGNPFSELTSLHDPASERLQSGGVFPRPGIADDGKETRQNGSAGAGIPYGPPVLLQRRHGKHHGHASQSG